MGDSDKCKDDESLDKMSVEELKKRFLELKAGTAVTSRTAMIDLETITESGKKKIRQDKS